jgi:predicted PhzF superfamily epimerase YddE/YHI9
MGSPSEILAKLKIEDDQIKEVIIGGRAVITGELEI